MTEKAASPMFARVALIGIGLINSSLARVLRRDGLAGHIAICARTRATLDKAMALGLADSATIDPGVAVKDADLVVIGTPLGAYPDVAQNMGSSLKPGCIVTDVGSVKEAVIRTVAPHLPAGVHLVPAHPVAGTEHSGPEAGFADCSRSAGASSRRPPGPIRRRSSGWPKLWAPRRHEDPDDGSGTPRQGAWPSRPTCRTSSPTPSSARQPISKATFATRSSSSRPAVFRDFTRHRRLRPDHVARHPS